MPPERASGTAVNTSSASRVEPSAEQSRRKIRKKQAGTTIVSRCARHDQILELAAPCEPVSGRQA